MELTYTMQGDYLIPDLTVPESPKIGKYGMLRRTFLREHRDGIYTGMLLEGTLNSHLEEVDAQANRMMDKLTEQMKNAQRRDRADEVRRPDEVGSADELDPELGGGSGPERPDLRVSLPSEEEQQELIAEAEDETTSAFVISQEDIDAVLTRGSGIHDGKYRIYEQYLKQETHEANVSFLKDEYGIGGCVSC